MSKTRDFDNILDECLERIIAGGETVEQCLVSYSEHAAELEPLLRMASGAKLAVDIEPSAEFRERAAYRFQAALRDMETAKPRGLFGWQARWVMPLAALAVILVGGGGTVAAAGNSLPDEPLYTVKLATEAVRIALTPTDIGKAELYVKLADERVAEIILMAEEGKVGYVESTTQRLDGQLLAVSNNIGMASVDMASEAALEAAPRMMVIEETPAAGAVPGDSQDAQSVLMAPAPAPVPDGGSFNAAKTETGDTVNLPLAPETAPVTATPGTESGESGTAEDSMIMEATGDIAVLPPKFTASPEPLPPSKITAGTMPLPAGAYGGAGSDGELSVEETLKVVIAQKAAQNTVAIQAILEKVPEEARPALLRALAVANAGYENALKLLP